MPPAARVTDLHACPSTPAAPIIGPGAPNVFICGVPAARIGDTVSCYGIETIVTGESTVIIAGKPAARIGDMTTRGGGCPHAGSGVITTGCPTVFIGSVYQGIVLKKAAESGAPFCDPFEVGQTSSEQSCFEFTPLGNLEIVPNDQNQSLSSRQVTQDEYSNLLKESGYSTRDWGITDVVKWKTPELIGGDPKHLQKYKDQWVKDHKTTIKVVSRINGLPPELLAGVAWIEAGGDPVMIDDVAYNVRSFDHLADPYLEPLTVTKKPELTSFGDVSIQIRRAAETLGMNSSNLTSQQQDLIMDMLKNDQTNLGIVGKHLSELKNIDFSEKGITEIGDEEIRVIGARYNRGPDLSLDKIKENTSYGNLIIKIKDRVSNLLK